MYIHCSNSRIVKEIIHLNDCVGGCIIFCVWQGVNWKHSIGTPRRIITVKIYGKKRLGFVIVVNNLFIIRHYNIMVCITMWSLRMWMATFDCILLVFFRWWGRLSTRHLYAVVQYVVWHMLLENSIGTEVVSCRYLYKTYKWWRFMIDIYIIEMYRRTIWIFADKCSSFKKCAKDVPALRDNRKKARVNWRVTDV